jgi:hypothetical protein
MKTQTLQCILASLLVWNASKKHYLFNATHLTGKKRKCNQQIFCLSFLSQLQSHTQMSFFRKRWLNNPNTHSSIHELSLGYPFCTKHCVKFFFKSDLNKIIKHWKNLWKHTCVNIVFQNQTLYVLENRDLFAKIP